ncbi:MAG TPA: antitoxin MazE family protein [Acetobacteraceae bacterium]|nr:antitoxin MazE family protein [Acetobacteraceae bacterium]
MSVRPTSRGRTARYWENLRRMGLRPVQIWMPDTRLPTFSAEARRQCELVNAADQAEHLIDWVENVSVFDEDATR